MSRPKRRLILLVVTGAVAAFTVGTGVALAHGPGSVSKTNDLVADAAKRLDVGADKLKDAIRDAAVARVDEAVKDDDLDADDADAYKDEIKDNLQFAISISRAKTVAANVSTTKAKLDTAFREARKAQIVARIDQAVKDGDLDEADAKQLKAQLDDVRLPGYNSFGFGRGFGFGFGMRHGGGPGFGFGPGAHFGGGGFGRPAAPAVSPL